MMYSAYKLNKQCNNIQALCTAFPILKPSIVPCPVLTVASCPAYRWLYKGAYFEASLVAQMVKTLPIMKETGVKNVL